MSENKSLLKDFLRYGGNREGRVKLVREYIIPRLPQKEWDERFHPGPIEVEKASYRLAEVYYKNGNAAIFSSIGILTVLLILDIFTQLNPIVYGLHLDIWAVVFFVRPSLMGPNVIATATFDGYQDAKIWIKAQEMVFTNIGFVIFGVGFLLQILAVQFVRPSEWINTNLLLIPDVILFIILLLNLFIGLNLYGKIQSWYTDPF